MESPLSVSFTYASVLLAALALSLLLTPVARAVALRLKIVDHPGHRKIHHQPKPYLGGVAIYLSFFTVVFGGIAAAHLTNLQGGVFDSFAWLSDLAQRMDRVMPKLIAIFIGGTAAFLVGLWDDVTNAGERLSLKLGVQVLAAALAVMAGVSVDFFGTPWLNVPLSMVWIVGIMNAFNLLDNMDGLSGGIACIAIAVFAALAALLEQHFVALILFALFGSILGFLRYNLHPSSIFMGDAGSLFIGYLLGALTILESYVDGDGITVFSLFMPPLILGVPLADTISVIIIRMKNRKPIYVGDRNHLSHRLVALGLSQRWAVRLLYCIGIVLGINALLLPWLSLWQGAVVLGQSMLLTIIFSVLLYYGNRARHSPSGKEARAT